MLPTEDNKALQKDIERDEAYDAFLAGYRVAQDDLGLKAPSENFIEQAFREWYTE